MQQAAADQTRDPRSPGAPPRSVITCDLEGRVETYDEGAREIFGYAPEEVIGRRRVSLFSPGPVVLGHVQGWLDSAREHGEFSTRTVFLRRDGSPFAAEIRITPTFRRVGGEKVHVGYCGLTRPLPGVTAAQVMPPISLGTRLMAWLVITRAPFLTASLVPILIAAAWTAYQHTPQPFPWLLFGCAMAAALCLHVGANTFNDYFDWRSGTDPANNDYFMPYSGGSRAIELGLIGERGLLWVAMASFAAALALALPVLVARGPGLLVLGAAGAFLAYFYTAPPLRLSARRGLGELSVFLAFGPLLVAGTTYALTGTVTAGDFVVGVPIGLLTTAILWINEFPDTPADRASGKLHLVASLGRRRARWGYSALLAGAFGSLALLVAVGTLPAATLAALLALPLAVHANRIALRHYRDRGLVRANVATIRLHALAGALLAAGLLLAALSR